MLSEELEKAGHPIALKSLSKLERRERNVDADDLVALAAVFGVRIEDLLLDPSGLEVDRAVRSLQAEFRGVEFAEADLRVAEDGLFLAEDRFRQVQRVLLSDLDERQRREAVKQFAAATSLPPKRVADLLPRDGEGT